MTDLKEDSAPWTEAEPLTANVSGADSSTDAEALGIREALTYARVLVGVGCVLFRAPGMILPARWQMSAPGESSLRAVADWREGDGLAIVGGTVFDVLDTDPRNGGAASEAALREALAWPRSYGMTATPSGGTHNLIRALGIGKHSPVQGAPGVDLQGGRPDGAGRGFAWLPPTRRASKLDGTVRPYVWLKPPAALDVPDADERAARAALRARALGPREVVSPASTPAAVPVPVEPFASASTRDGSWTRDQARAEIAKRLDEVRTATDGTINTTLNNSSLRIGRFVGSGTVKRDWAEAALRDALLASGRGWSELDNDDRGTIRSGLDAGIKQPFVITEDGARKVSGSAGEAPARKLRIGFADAVTMRRTRYVWEGRYPVGVMTFIGGREGTGKSTIAYDRAAQLTIGKLPGEHFGQAKRVIVCAGEDSWEHTIVPRLVAAGADLSNVMHIVADTVDGPVELMLPTDTMEVAEIVRDYNVGMMILDPLIAMLDQSINSDKYQEVYAGLKPVIGMAAMTGVAVVGITHLNKTAGVDPLSRMMASRAFSAAPRSVLMTHLDESEDESDDDFAGPNDRPREKFILGHEKHNLGPKAPTLAYHVESADVGWDDGPIVSSRIVWDGESKNTVAAAMNGQGNRKPAPTVNACAGWLVMFLSRCGGSAEARTVKAEAEKAGMSWRSMQRAADDVRFFRTPPAPGCPARWGLVGADDDGDS